MLDQAHYNVGDIGIIDYKDLRSSIFRLQVNNTSLCDGGNMNIRIVDKKCYEIISYIFYNKKCVFRATDKSLISIVIALQLSFFTKCLLQPNKASNSIQEQEQFLSKSSTFIIFTAQARSNHKPFPMAQGWLAGIPIDFHSTKASWRDPSLRLTFVTRE